MAWSQVGARGGGNIKTSGTTVTGSPSANTTVGNILVAYFAIDNIQTTDGASTDVTGFSDDSGGNTWTIVKQWTNGNGTAATGATAGIAICRIKTQLTTSTVVTMTSGTATAKAFIMYEFAMSGGANFSYNVAGSIGAVADAATSSPSKVLSGLASQEYLFLANDAIEADSSTLTYTNDVDYSGLAVRGTSASTGTGNIGTRGSYRIFTGTGDTHQATGVTASDMAGVLVALKEVQVDFPDALATVTATATPILSDEQYVSAGFVEALELAATATCSFASEVVGQETVGLTATASLVFSSEVVGQETLVCAANAPPSFKSEVVGEETLGLTATATPALQVEAYGTKSFTSSPRGFVANVGAYTASGTIDIIEIPITTAVAAGDTVVGVCANNSARTITSVTDSSGNSYTVHASDTAVNPAGQIFSALVTQPLLVGDLVTIKLNAVSGGRAAVLSSFGGQMTGYLDSPATASNHPTAGTSNALATGSATAYADEIIIRGLVTDNLASSITAPTGYTKHQQATSSGTIRTASIASKVVSATGVQTDTWNWTGTSVNVGFVIGLKMLATIETLNANATVSITAGEETNFETLNANATATLILSAETYVPVSGSPYIESLALTANVTIQAGEFFNFAPETLALTATATPVLSNEAGVYSETLALTATATPTISAFSVFFNDGPINAAALATLTFVSQVVGQETLGLTATATPTFSSQVVGQETLGVTITATLIFSGESFIGNTNFPESVALQANATPVISVDHFIDVSGSAIFDSTSILTVAIDTAYASKITVAEAGTAISGWAYLDGLGSAATGSVGKFKMVLYDVDGSGFPRNLIAVGSERTVTKGFAAAWVNSDFAGQSIAPGDYWIGPHIGGTANVMRFHRATLATGNRWQVDAYVGGENDPWAFDGTKVGGYKFSVYLTTDITTVTGTAYTDSVRIANATATPTLATEIFDAGTTSSRPPGFHGLVERTGSATSGVTGSTGIHASRPWMKGAAVAAGWQDLEPTYRNYVWPTAWENSFIDACDNNYKIIPRIFAGRAAPDWLFTGANSTRGGYPAVQTVYLISVEGQGATDVPVPWNATLALHYTALMDWLNTKLNSPMPGGRPGTYADYVIAVPITLPTTQGSEMPQAYGSGTWTGVYKGVSGTWDLQSNNKREWLSVASSGTTDAEKQAATIQDLGDAWSAAVVIHLNHLTNVRSSLALGGLFTDNQARAIEITNSAVWQANKDRLECYSTNLRTGPSSPYTWRSWNPKTCQCYDHVNAINGICANQTASDANIGPDPVPGQTGVMADPFQHALIEARDDFDTYYVEITTSKATAFTTWLRDVYQPSLIPSSSSSVSETLSLTATATPKLSAESVTATGSFIETLNLTATATETLPGELFESGGLLQVDILGFLSVPVEGGLLIETLQLSATAALSSLVSERMIQVETLVLNLASFPVLSGEDAGFPLPPYDMYLDVGIFDVSYNVQIQSNDQQVEIANYYITVEV